MDRGGSFIIDNKTAHDFIFYTRGFWSVLLPLALRSPGVLVAPLVAGFIFVRTVPVGASLSLVRYVRVNFSASLVIGVFRNYAGSSNTILVSWAAGLVRSRVKAWEFLTFVLRPGGIFFSIVGDPKKDQSFYVFVAEAAEKETGFALLSAALLIVAGSTFAAGVYLGIPGAAPRAGVIYFILWCAMRGGKHPADILSAVVEAGGLGETGADAAKGAVLSLFFIWRKEQPVARFCARFRNLVFAAALFFLGALDIFLLPFLTFVTIVYVSRTDENMLSLLESNARELAADWAIFLEPRVLALIVLNLLILALAAKLYSNAAKGISSSGAFAGAMAALAFFFSSLSAGACLWFSSVDSEAWTDAEYFFAAYLRAVLIQAAAVFTISAGSAFRSRRAAGGRGAKTSWGAKVSRFFLKIYSILPDADDLRRWAALIRTQAETAWDAAVKFVGRSLVEIAERLQRLERRWQGVLEDLLEAERRADEVDEWSWDYDHFTDDPRIMGLLALCVILVLWFAAGLSDRRREALGFGYFCFEIGLMAVCCAGVWDWLVWMEEINLQPFTQVDRVHFLASHVVLLLAALISVIHVVRGLIWWWWGGWGGSPAREAMRRVWRYIRG